MTEAPPSPRRTSAPNPDHWRQAMAGLALACAGAEADGAGELVMAARELLAAAPGGAMGKVPTREQVEAWIAAGAETVAALALVEDWAGYMLSHGAGGTHMATVAWPSKGGEASAEAPHAAIALIGAMAAMLAGSALRLDEATGLTSHSGVRLN